MTKIYLCGPITGLPDGNKQAFSEAKQRLQDRFPSSFIVNPHNTCANIVAEHTGTEQELWNKCMRRDIQQLMSCDIVVLLDGWQNSRGATLERSIAQQVGIDVETLEYLLA